MRYNKVQQEYDKGQRFKDTMVYSMSGKLLFYVQYRQQIDDTATTPANWQRPVAG